MKKSKLHSILYQVIPSLLFFSLFFNVRSNAQPPAIAFDDEITGLVAPLDFVNAGDGTNRIFIVQQSGQIRVFDENFVEFPDHFLAVADVSGAGGEQGLLSMAFHPDYENNGFFWVYYVNTAGNLQIDRYHATGISNTAEPLSRQAVLTIPHPTNGNHNGGKLNFGPDGFLYLSIGDGGGAGDMPNNAQTGTTLLGKMIRIDVSIAGAPYYTSPASNPYTIIPDPMDMVRDEIWAFGLRNPFRWSFDASGNVWIGDVGQNAWEEINHNANTPDLNYGWRCFEGMLPYTSPPPSCPGPFTSPVYVYPNTGQSAVTGGMVYRGLLHPSLQGYCYSADVYSGNFYLTNALTNATTVEPAFLDFVTGFGETENGELFFVSLDGSAYRLLPASALPVELTQFKATVRNSLVDLDWKTATEQNVDGFEIEFSADGIRFNKVGRVTATNNPAGATYNFRHDPGNRSIAYYRLQIVDLDGSTTYSKIVNVSLNRKNENFIYPTIINNGLINVYTNEQFKEFNLFNSMGALVKKQYIGGRTGRIDIPVKGLPAGAYIGQLVNEERSISQKIIVQ